MLIAQISDLHIRPKGCLAYGVSETNLFAEQAIYALLRLQPQPDCVLATGDLTDCGLDEEFAILTELFDRLPMPVYAIVGNHDRREPFRRAFARGGYLPKTGFLNYVVACGPMCIIGLDSLVAGKSHGELHAETLEFLQTALRTHCDKPTMIMLHHPPFATGIAHMDRQRLWAGSSELAQIVSRAPQVQRILCGHLHRSTQVLFAGTLCQTAPSVGHQVALDLCEAAPPAFVLEEPEILLHSLQDKHIVTHTAKVQRAPGPFPFVLPPEYPGAAELH